jgi:AraC-like DNA-binding protein
MEAAAYAEHPLDPALAPFVEAAWSVTAGPRGARHLVVPDGCVDLVVRQAGGPLVAGPMTRPARVELAPREVVRGLRFRPGVAPALLDVEADELLDRTVPLGRAWCRAPGLQEAVATRLERREPDAVAMRGAALLAARPEQAIGALAAELGFSERQLRRRFLAAIGYGPKRLARVARLQSLLREGRRRPSVPAAELAYVVGYADQPHMHRDVRALAGTSPKGLLAERGRFVQDSGASGRQSG